jgi:hypothetical protein
MVMVFFTVAMFYASVCSASCAIGVCPDQPQQTASHDCDQMPAHHAGQSGHKAPESPDCSRHQHPNMLLAKSGEIAKVQLSVTDHLPATAVAISKHDLTVGLINREASDLAPPLSSNVPLYQQISVLRI